MYDVWLAPLRALGLEGDVLVVEAPRELRTWVAERFARVLQASVAAVLGPEVTVDVRSAPAASAPRRPAAARIADSRAPEHRDQPEAHLRAVRHRRRQPLRPRRRAGRGRAPRARLQPALHLRAPRRRQDPPAALDRQLRPRLRRRPQRPLHDGRDVHQPVPRRPARAGDMDRFKGRYRHADVLLIDDIQFLASQGQDRGGVLPHLQRAARPRQPTGADLRSPPARPQRPRGPPARALRGRPGHRHRAARPHHARRRPAQARPARRHRPRRRRRPRRCSPTARPTASARSRARSSASSPTPRSPGAR